ncbi:hypothetical protein [Paraburkholderia humisilvae]|uniref:Uncharacterized protein n=1 Tax=Paraburkholderia humisilvae TaxID=627669 RepID=A0A6J5EYU8_9BURK|nr:hypothetical protein [Paraburkholderia humisilvae]CAB3771780.1 hypothetical protein LMG29542_06708 [Paraburkholderia humisilvae]
MNIATVGLDLAKNVLQVHAVIKELVWKFRINLRVGLTQGA